MDTFQREDKNNSNKIISPVKIWSVYITYFCGYIENIQFLQ